MPLKLELNELHSDGKLQSVHLSIFVHVSEVPDLSQYRSRKARLEEEFPGLFS